MKHELAEALLKAGLPDDRLATQPGKIEDIDKAQRTIRVRASDATQDRDGERIHPAGLDGHGKGWVLDEYEKNPVVLFMHSVFWPIGAGLETVVTEGALMQTIEFTDMSGLSGEMADFNRYVAASYLQGKMRGVSVGFEPMAYFEPGVERTAENLSRRSSGERIPWASPGRDYVEQKLWEDSLVTIGSNPNAVTVQRAAKAMGTIAELLLIPKDDREREARKLTRRPAELIELLDRCLSVMTEEDPEPEKQITNVTEGLSGYAKVIGCKPRPTNGRGRRLFGAGR